MSEEAPKFVDFVQGLAEEAEMAINVENEGSVMIHFDMGNDRDQRVWVRAGGQDPEGNLIVGISSPAMQLPKGQELSKEAANRLLKENCSLFHGCWALVEGEEANYIIAADTQIAQSLDANEFSASVRAMAWLADDFEQKLGIDAF